jgi:hypothetical protein
LQKLVHNHAQKLHHTAVEGFKYTDGMWQVEAHCISSFENATALFANQHMNTWFFVDIDNTVLTTRSGLATEQFMTDQFYSLAEGPGEPGRGRSVARNERGLLEAQALMLGNVADAVPCDEHVVSFLQRLPPERTVFITARHDGHGIRYATLRQLEALLGQTRVNVNNIIFTCDNNKGSYVMGYMRANAEPGASVVLIDDNEQHLVSVARRMPYGFAGRLTCVLYTGQLRRVLEFHANYPQESHRLKDEFMDSLRKRGVALPADRIASRDVRS